MSEWSSKIWRQRQTLQQMKFTEEIYNQISFIEIIVIIVKEYL